MYRNIQSIGANEPEQINNPISYCTSESADNHFLHGSAASTTDGEYSKPCQTFMAEYCANEWDSICENLSNNPKKGIPNNWGVGGNDDALRGLTAGEILIHNTAKTKYLVGMINAKPVYKPFDPSVATSPMITYWVPTNDTYSTAAVGVYTIKPEKIGTLDNDHVMNKILDKKYIAPALLANIFHTMKREGTLPTLKGTRLGRFFSSEDYFVARGGLEL